jgi:hypothetical protein
LLRKLMSIKLEPLNCQGKCLQLSLSYPCSNQRPWNSNKKKKRKIASLKRQSKDLNQDFLQQTPPMQSSTRLCATEQESNKTLKRESPESKCWTNLYLMVLSLMLLLGSTLMYQRTCRFPNLISSSNHSWVHNQVLTCVTSRSPSK